MTKQHLHRHGGNLAALAETFGGTASDYLDFSANINPFGPPSWLRTHIASTVSSLTRYPEPRAQTLHAVAAKTLAVDPAELVCGNGAAELIQLSPQVVRALCGHMQRAVIVAPCYVDYAPACHGAGLAVEYLPCREDHGFKLDQDALHAALRTPALVIVASPSNPVGVTTDARFLRELALAHAQSFFLIDEAFACFAPDFQSLAPSRGRPDNLAVWLSLTKSLAIPGLRLGFAAGHPDFCAALSQRLPCWNVNAMAAAVGSRALAEGLPGTDLAFNVAALRAPLRQGLQALGLTVFDSRVNYQCCRLPADWPDAPALRQRLIERRVVIRSLDNVPGLSERFVRLAVKSAEDNQRLLDELARIAPSAAHAPTPTPQPRKTPAIMVVGTTSNAGKSILTAAICRLLRRRGLSVAPFKAQNMSLNSAVTAGGGEMGRAQVLQAAACGLAPDVRMNPVLLKPVSERGSQVIVLGQPTGVMRVREYHEHKLSLWATVTAAYDSLAAEHDIMVIEGAGSPAEINLKSHDIVNMAVARYAKAKVLLVTDIDRGGSFAALFGTMELLPEDERALVAGYVLNRFRGDPSLLGPGIDELARATGLPTLGVIPNIERLDLPDEDTVSFKAGECDANLGQGVLDVAVVDLPHASNLTDLDALSAHPALRLRRVDSAERLGRPEAIILPGTRNSFHDLLWLRERGLEEAILDQWRAGCELVGICGGLQMLGLRLCDPLGVESQTPELAGLGLLAIETRFDSRKTLVNEAAQAVSGEQRGYEIHHGQSLPAGEVIVELVSADGRPIGFRAPADPRRGRVWGSYQHGLFDNETLRQDFVARLAATRFLGQSDAAPPPDVDAALDRLADIVGEHLDIESLLGKD